MELREGMIVHCDTKEKAMRFLKECHKMGLTWSSGRSIIDGSIDNYEFGKHTVYYVNNNGLSYGRKCNAPKNRLISFSELIKTKEVKQIKVYQMPYFIHEDVEKVIVNELCVIVFLKTGEKGIAKCCPEDEFEERHGYSIAYQRAKIKQLKKQIHEREELLKIIVR